MRRTRALAAGMVVSATVIGSLLLAAPANAADDVVFADPAFSACVHGQVGTDPTAPITVAQAATVTSLICYQAGVTSVDGIQAFTSLKTLQIASNSVTSLAPLAGLTQLTSLEFSENSVSDLTPLAGLTALTQLSFSYNQVSDLWPLAGLTALTDISASSNDISDVGVMAGWPELERVAVAGNRIADLGALKDLPNIEQVQAYYQTVTLPPLAAGASQPNPIRNWDGTVQGQVEGASNFALASDGASWQFTTAADNTLSWTVEDDNAEVSFLFAGSILQQSLAAEAVPTTLVDDSASTAVNHVVTIDVIANDGLPTQPALIDDSLMLLDAEGYPTAQVTVVGGSFQVVDGVVVFTPTEGFTGTVAEVSYQVMNGDGVTSTAIIRVVVTPAVVPSDSSTTPTAVDIAGTASGSTTGSPTSTGSLASTGLNVWPLVMFAALLFAGAGVMLRRRARV